MRVIARKALREYWEKHNDVESSLKSWYSEVEKSEWSSPKNIKVDFPSASILSDNRVVFNIKGNKYRLIVKINYDFKIVWIRFIGTHSEYNKVNANTI